MKILIVEDIKIMQRALTYVLVEEYGIEEDDIYHAVSGEEAIEIVKNNRIQHVFLDINLPGISGIETITKLLEIKPRLHITMCTASKNKKTLLECIKSGARDYIVKPASSTKVAEVLGICKRNNTNIRR